MERLSSGLRINSAKDDTAGLAISDRMTSQIRGLNQAARNAHDGISLAQTAEGAMQETTNIIQRIRELAVQSANDTNSSSDRTSLQAEVNQLKSEIDRIANNTSFNNQNILDGTFIDKKIQIGAKQGETIGVSVDRIATDNLGGGTIEAVNKLKFLGNGVCEPVSNRAEVFSVWQHQEQTLHIEGAGTADVWIAEAWTSKTVAEEVNRVSEITGVKATARNECHISGFLDGNISFTLNNTYVAVDIVDGNIQALADRINEAVLLIDPLVARVENDELVIAGNKDYPGEDYSGWAIWIVDFDHEVQGATLNVTGLDGNTGTIQQGGKDTIVTQGVVTFTSKEPCLPFKISSNISAENGSIFNVDANEEISTYLCDIDISIYEGASLAIEICDGSLCGIDSERAELGAIQNRFESTISNLQNIAENLTAARSRIMDADIAAESSSLTKQNILQQAGTSVLSQANQQPQLVLSLLQNF
jgi:flagellin